MKSTKITNPLITVSIPTYNSENFIQQCLQAVNNQTYKNIEINLVDGNSKDKTLEIAKTLGVKNIFINTNSLLSSRQDGVKFAKGDYVLLLDSDQILEPEAIQKSVDKFTQGYDMLMMEEDVYSDKNFIEKLFKLDRKLIKAVNDISPYTGVMLPRFYRRSIISQVFEKIPTDVIQNVGGQDHAIIYLEAWNISQKVGIVENAVKHIEPDTFKKMWKKFYRWGGTSVDAHTNKYNELLNKKERFRTGLFKKGLFIESIGSILLLIIKGIPYKTGYLTAKLKKSLK